MAEKIFDSDEMSLNAVDPAWSEEELLDQDGIFFLKDVAAKLGIPTLEFKNKARKVQDSGKNPWEIMGIRKTWTHWQVRMRVFKPFFRDWWTCPKVTEVDEAWDTNDLIAQKGFFYLNDVCRKIPFSNRQIRYQIQKCKDPKKSLGVWKDHNLKAFIVDMSVFGPCLKKLWLGLR